MKCSKCSGMMFLDRTFSDNKTFEVYCIMCGIRKFVGKDTGLGKWLTVKETARLRSAL